MNRLLVCFGAKGGQGTTTVAAALALQLATTGETLLVDPTGDVSAVLGLPVPTPIAKLDADCGVAAGKCLSVAHLGRPLDIVDRVAVGLALTRRNVVVDGGTGSASEFSASAERVIVVRNCYLSLRRATGLTFDVAAVLVEGERALRFGDAADVLGGRAVQVPHDAAVARAVDAGMFGSRRPPTISGAAGEILGLLGAQR